MPEFRTRRGRRVLSDRDVQELLDMYEQDVPISAILAHFGIARSTLYQYLRPYLVRKD